MVEGTRLPCQVCGRSLTVRKDGLTKPHNTHRNHSSRCSGSGHRQARWPVGQLLWHHAGDLWEVVEDREATSRWGDYYLRCVLGRELGREMVAHGEYMHRDGWKTTDVAAAWAGVPTTVLSDLAAEAGFNPAECC